MPPSLGPRPRSEHALDIQNRLTIYATGAINDDLVQIGKLLVGVVKDIEPILRKSRARVLDKRGVFPSNDATHDSAYRRGGIWIARPSFECHILLGLVLEIQTASGPQQ